ncbi:hypothetical protein MYX75_04805, partial [Acidobacteria bacterium AH-259-A15]|nr:hypothetical protein [Acidobacteria bacterium AH-259-A15]
MIQMSLPPHLRHFTDREPQVAAFDELWSRDEPWILAFDGLSGNGKSTLIDYLIETRCKPKSTPYGLLNFEQERLRRSPKALMDSLLEGPGLAASLDKGSVKEYRSRREGIFADRDRRQLEINAQQIQTSVEESRQEMKLELAKAIRELDRQARERATDAWLDCIEGLGNREVVFFLDTYELFETSSDPEDVSWLWQEVLGRCRGRLPGLRVVVGSRNRLRFPERGARELAVTEFSRKDSDSLLSALGVNDGSYRAVVYDRLAKGHALITKMAAEAWTEGSSAADVPNLTDREEAVEWLQRRILARVAPALKKVLEWALVLRSFDKETLSGVLKIEVAEQEFRQLTQYSFVSRARSSRGWTCHDLIRRVQLDYLAREQPRELEAFHRRAAEFYANPVERLYHRFFFEPEVAFREWTKEESNAAWELAHERWARLLDLVESPELDLSHPM